MTQEANKWQALVDELRAGADHPECDHLMKWGTHDENGCSLCSCLTAAPTEEGG
jgi:hypothetical protein